MFILLEKNLNKHEILASESKIKFSIELSVFNKTTDTLCQKINK